MSELVPFLSLRMIASILGAVALCGLVWRTIAYFQRMTSLERALAGVLTGIILVGAIGSYRLDRIGAPASGVIVPVILLRVVVLVVVYYWPVLVGRTGTLRERLGR